MIAIEDARLQAALSRATKNFREGREQAWAAYPDIEALRDHFKRVRDATLQNLGAHLLTFEEKAQENGAVVHWAADAAEACGIAIEVAQAHGVRLVTKSKSMLTEEIRLNPALEAAGIEPVETDLGEWIVQLAGEPPSHIIAPAIHKTRDEVARLFEEHSGEPPENDDIPTLTLAARNLLRERFLQADMGISGANIGVAETGSIVLVTNEGNGRMVTSLPKIHLCFIGIEKIAPAWNDAAAWLSLLARSATGQPLSIYTSIITGPARTSDHDGPEEVHIVLVDNGRSKLLGTKYEEVLQCIRCGSCLNVCPVYRVAGGHAYKSPYSGPIGAVISPLLFGQDRFAGLPQASSLCGACLEVCPVRIDLPSMLIELRNDQVEAGLVRSVPEALENLVGFGLMHEKLLTLGRKSARLLQTPFQSGDFIRLPGALHPSQDRRLPALAPRAFREWWEEL